MIRRGWRRARIAALFGAALAATGCATGRFATAAFPVCGDARLRGVLVTDLDGDAVDDVAVGCKTRRAPLRGHLEVWLSDGAGRLHKAQTRALGSFETGGEGAGPITAADFDEDGRPDLVVVDTAGTTHGVSLLYGEAEGRFGEATYFERPITWVATADVDGDGHQDLIPVLNRARRYLPGDGGRIDAAGRPRLMARDTGKYGPPQRADIDGDGRIDVVIPKPSAGRLRVFASSRPAGDILLGKAVRRVRRVHAGALVDGDEVPDLLVSTRRTEAGNHLRWVLTADGARLSDPIAGVPAEFRAAQVADFNGDGVADLLVTPGYRPERRYHGAARPLVFIGTGDGDYADPVVLALPGSPGRKVVGDFDSDGRSDLFYGRITDSEAQAIVFLSRW